MSADQTVAVCEYLNSLAVEYPATMASIMSTLHKLDENKDHEHAELVLTGDGLALDLLGIFNGYLSSIGAQKLSAIRVDVGRVAFVPRDESL